MGYPDDNPKTRYGMAKPGIRAIPPVALLHCGRGMEDGAGKYGLTNWREHDVSASVYYNAMFRHMAAWWDGENEAQDSGVHHLGHVMACCAILLDAEHLGKLNDDRPPVPGPFADAVKEMTAEVEPPDVDFGAALGDPVDWDAEDEAPMCVAFELHRGEISGTAEVEILPRITFTELSGKIFDFVTRNSPHGTVQLSRFQDHIGSRDVAGYSQNNRTRMAFYIDAYDADAHFGLIELDNRLRDAGFDFGSSL